MFVYEYLVERMRTPALQRSYHYKEEIVEPWRTAVAGACAGMLSWLPGIPFDVITKFNQLMRIIMQFNGNLLTFFR